MSGEFSESIKKGSEPPGHAHGRDGKNPAAGEASAPLSPHLLEQAKTGLNRPTEALPEGAPHLVRRPIVPPPYPDRCPSVGGSFADLAEVTGAVTGPHAREVTSQVTSIHARPREPLTLGVDIGNSGGLALVTADGGLLDVQPMPVLADGPKGRPTVNGPLLASIVKRWAPTQAYVEMVGPRPGEAAGGAFSFGRARGLVEGVLAAEGVPARMVTAPVWKRHCGIPAGRDGVKDLARAEACRRWPGMADRFAAKGSDGLAEAGLIAVAGMAREAGR